MKNKSDYYTGQDFYPFFCKKLNIDFPVGGINLNEENVIMCYVDF